MYPPQGEANEGQQIVSKHRQFFCGSETPPWVKLPNSEAHMHNKSEK